MTQFVRGNNPHKALKIGEFSEPNVGDRYKLVYNIYWNGSSYSRYAFNSNSIYDLVAGTIIEISQIDSTKYGKTIWIGKGHYNPVEDIEFPIDFVWFMDNHENFIRI